VGAPCIAGEVALPDGKVLSGDVTIAADGSLTIAPPGQPAKTIPLTDVVRATVSPAVASAAGTQGAALTWPWRSSDVGKSRVAGMVKDETGAFSVSAAGWGAWSGVDSFHFVHQMLDGDGQILARVTLPGTDGSRAIGAVMIRESLDPTAPFVAAALGPRGPGRLQARPYPPSKQPIIDIATVVESSKVGWLRVSRQGDLFTAYRSVDGSSWEETGSQTIKMAAKVFVGLASSSNVNMLSGPVRYDNVSVIPGPPATTAAASALPTKGIVLTDGRALAGDVTAITTDTVHFKPTDGGTSRSLPVEDVAWVLLQPTFPNLSSRGGGAGVLLRSGDFFDGELITLADGKVNVVSTVFGPKTLDATTEAIAVALREPEQWATAWHVRDKTGQVFSGPDIKIENDKLLIGKHSIALPDVREVFRPQPTP